MADSDADRGSPMADDDNVTNQVRRPTRVPSIKIEPPCDIDDFDDTSCMTTSSSNYNALSPSMSPNQRAMVDLRNQPGNYKKNLTARFLQQGHSEDDGYYRSETDSDIVQPDEKRSKSLDRGLEYDPSDEGQPLDLSTSFSKPSSDLRNKFEARARKMHRRNRAESEENLANLHLNTPEHLLAMQRLSRSDAQLDRLNHIQSSAQSISPSSIADSDNVPSSAGDLQEQHRALLQSTSPHTAKKFMPLPPISMMYNRGQQLSSSTDGSVDMDKGSPFNFLPVSNLPINPAIAANLYGLSTERNSMSPIPGMTMAAFLEWHQMQSHVNQTLVNQCFICKQTFPGFDNMAKHVAKHLPTEVKTDKDNNNRVHVCKVCNRSFSRSDMLTRHMRLHTGLKPYECKECGQVFSRSDHLNTHKRTHTGEKPYQCPKCPYAACRRDMITRHMRIHNNNKDASTKKRRSRLGMLYCKDSVSGSSVESTDSTPSRGGSMSGNSFDSSFESSDLRWPPRLLLDPSDLMRNQSGRGSWSASNSFDNSDYSRRSGAWSSLTSADSIESDSHPHGTSFDGDYLSSPPKVSTSSMSAAVFSKPTTQIVTSERVASFDMKNRRPSLVRQDASLDNQDMNKLTSTAMSVTVPFTDYKTKLEYRNSNEAKSMDCTDDASMDKDSVDTADSPRIVESPVPPMQETSGTYPFHQRLTMPFLPKQASLSDELNLQKCALDE